MNPTKFLAVQSVTEKPITLSDGSVEKVWFKPVGNADWHAFQVAMRSDDPAACATAMLRLILLSLCEPDGSKALTWDQVNALDEGVSEQFFSAAYEVCKPKPRTGNR